MKDLAYELAVILKEKGFNEPCIAYFNRHNKLVPRSQADDSEWQFVVANTNRTLKAPTHQQVTDWFRESHDIYITVQRDWDKGGLYNLKYVIELNNIENCKIFRVGDYYEVLEKAIKEALKLI
jgi:hypothetical protein